MDRVVLKNNRCVDVGQSVMEFPVKDGTRIHSCSCHEESGLRSCITRGHLATPENPPDNNSFPLWREKPLEVKNHSTGRKKYPAGGFS